MDTFPQNHQGVSLVYHQTAKRYTASRDDIQPKGLMISTALRAVMIYQTCGLDKNKKADALHQLFCFLAEAEGFEPPWAYTQTVFKTASL